MKTEIFEHYLVDKHAEQYHGTDDMMIDDYADWLCSLDVQEVIDYAEEAIQKVIKGEIDSKGEIKS